MSLVTSDKAQTTAGKYIQIWGCTSHVPTDQEPGYVLRLYKHCWCILLCVVIKLSVSFLLKLNN